MSDVPRKQTCLHKLGEKTALEVNVIAADSFDLCRIIAAGAAVAYLF